MQPSRVIPAALLLLTTLLAPLATQASVTDGNAVKVKSFSVRGGQDISSTGGPLAASLQARPTVVQIGADWCSACKATAPTIEAMQKHYAGKINFVMLDMSNAKTAAAAQDRAAKLGLSNLFAALKSATSSVAIVDSRSGKVYGTLYNDGTLGDYQKLIDRAIKGENG